MNYERVELCRVYGPNWYLTQNVIVFNTNYISLVDNYRNHLQFSTITTQYKLATEYFQNIKIFTVNQHQNEVMVCRRRMLSANNTAEFVSH